MSITGPTEQGNDRRVQLATLLVSEERWGSGPATSFVNGEYVNVEGARLPTFNPYTSERLLDVAEADSQLVESAAASAADAQHDWARLHPRERAKFLFRMADWIEAHRDEIALVEAGNTGKLYRGVTGWDVPNGAEVLRYYAGWCDKLAGQSVYVSESATMHTRMRPIGVVAAIIPWNFPFPCTSWKVAPALAAGCSVIVKPPERAPLSALYYAEAARAAGVPDGVFNVVFGRGESTGRSLVSNRHVGMVSFTGDAATLPSIVNDTAGNHAKVVSELGGKGAFIVFADADLEAAADGAIDSVFGVSGQNCCAGTRLLLEEPIADQLLERITVKLSDRVVGDNFDDASHQGPQIDSNHCERIQGFIDQAMSDGGRSVVGGTVETPFVEPTLIADVPFDSLAYRREIFGPVGVVSRFSGVEEAIRLANDSEYDLATSVWTTSRGKSEGVLSGVRTGTFWLNCFGYFDTSLPWGGLGRSGHGRELGRSGIVECCDEISVVETW